MDSISKRKTGSSNGHSRTNGVNHRNTSPKRSSAPKHPNLPKCYKLYIAMGILVYAIFLIYSFHRIQQHDLSKDKHWKYMQQQFFSSSSSLHSSHLTTSQHSSLFDKDQAEVLLQQWGSSAIRQILTAFTEQPMKDTVPGTGSFGDVNDNKDNGFPPQWIEPLPLRTQSPQELQEFQYKNDANQNYCHQFQSKLPTNYPYSDVPVPFVNTGNEPLPKNFPELEAPYCPVELDPYLPWIHDVFPTGDGKQIQFIAQNKRRCRTGKKFGDSRARLIPQIALFQPVSVKRIMDESTAEQLAPSLWKNNNNDNTTVTTTKTPPRYRLASFEEAASDGIMTRFICRFHALDTTADAGIPPKQKIVGETLSQYPFNYEYVSFRKRNIYTSLLTPKGKDAPIFLASTLLFNCPVPSHLQSLVASGQSILSDGTPTLYVDLVPIRTSVRYGLRDFYVPEDMAGPKNTWYESTKQKIPWINETVVSLKSSPSIGFDPDTRWGKRHVLPKVEASGRWANLPICQPPKPKEEEEEGQTTKLSAVNKNNNKAEVDKDTTDKQLETKKDDNKNTEKQHVLSACLWASASFKTRGDGKFKKSITDTQERLEEWILFHFMVGFDHIYVYDNSRAHQNDTTLEPILRQFPSSRITYIDWPSRVCNNNVPAHDNTGERSSQYAAENSCRARYGPYTKWMASFDTDEYFVPMGKFTNLKDMLQKADQEGTKILSFRSSRGKLRFDKTIESKQFKDARERKPTNTFLETYNCDAAGLPKPEWALRARKQIYQPEYVLYHFVHYSAVTRHIIQPYNDIVKGQKLWDGELRIKDNYREPSSSERITNELEEAVMVHTKTLSAEATSSFRKICHHEYTKSWPECFVGFGWPYETKNQNNNNNNSSSIIMSTSSLKQIEKYNKGKPTYDPIYGMNYNCYINEKVEYYWIPRLRQAIEDFRKKQQQ